MTDHRPPLLPSDYYLAALFWPDDDPAIAAEKYRKFKVEVESRIRIDPAQPQAGAALGIIAVVTGLISIGLTVVASFFKPKAPEPGTGGITATEKLGDSITSTNQAAPRVGFDSIQQPSSLGSRIPVIWARREYYNAQTSPVCRPAGYYGGIRVNLGLIWSQLWTYKGSQLLRAVFLLGEGGMGLPDNDGWAIGDNSLAGYGIDDNETRAMVSRATIYVNPTYGPIKNEHVVFGKSADKDFANQINLGANNVFDIRRSNEGFYSDFCYVTKPSTSTKFGVYSHIPNGMAYRTNPRFRPTIRVNTRSKNDGEDYEVDCDDDPQALADIWKARYHFSLRGGIYETSRDSEGALDFLYAGDEFRYKLKRKSDGETKIVFDSSNTDGTETDSDGEATCTDVASAISARQKSADDALIIGEVYKVGSLLAVLYDRDPDNATFVSEVDNEPIGGGQTMTYQFRVIRQGRLGLVNHMDYFDPNWSGETLRPTQWNRNVSLNDIDIPDTYYSCSAHPQIFRCAIATITLARSARIFEIGIASNVGIRINGLTNLRDCPSLRDINNRAGLAFNGNTYDKNKKLGVVTFNSGVLQRPETRISLFRVQVRYEGAAWESIGMTFGIKGTAGETIFNYLRFEMPSERRWEIRFEPITSWELRNDQDIDNPICIVESKSGNRHRTTGGVGITVEWYGEIKERNRKDFNITSIEPKEDVGLPDTDSNSMFDDWAMVAEAFAYNEIQTTADNSPEHEIVYVNTFTENLVPPTYDRIATVGINIFASTEFNQLSQFSAYIPEGKYARRLLESDVSLATHLFPDILRAYLSNKRFGRGQLIGDAMIDTQSFIEAAQWCRNRRYFYDGVDASAVNLLQWAADTASYHLLELNQRGGKWALVPAVYFPEDGPVPIAALFTAGNIIEDSFKLQYISDSERQPIRMSVKWREERQSNDLGNSGLFPVEREVFVQEAGQSDTDPIESLDLSNFCTNVFHAIDVACYFIRMRRLINHTISFSTTPDGLTAGLAAGSYIKVALSLTYFEDFANGVIIEDGTVFSTQNDLLGPGSHDVVAWDGVSDNIEETTITIDAEGKASPANIVFAKRLSTLEIRVYKVERISISEDGTIDIEAVRHPTDPDGTSRIGKNWTTYKSDDNWIIEGNDVECGLPELD
jgi:hypothetical protein